MLNITSTDFPITKQPEGLRAMKHRIYFAAELRSYLQEIEGDLVFLGAEYAYLRDRYINNACSIVPVVITDGCGLTLDGNLFLNDAEWRPDICQVTLQVVDSGFLSLIDNNMGIKAYVNVPRSKNDIDITSAVTVQTDLAFDSNTIGDPQATGREGVRVYDAYKMLVAFMTDGHLGFESDFLFPDDNNTDVRIPTLITAEELRGEKSAALFPYISFEDLHGDMARLYNLSFEVQNGVLRVEPDSYFRQSSQSITFDNPSEVSQESDIKSFYQKMKFGSKKDEDEDFVYYPNITFLGFRSEEYHLGGQCNTKATLDLEMSELTTDPNIIMAALPATSGGSVDFNAKAEDIYIVTCNASNEAIVYVNPVNSSSQYYNNLLTNFEVSLRWGDGVPFSIFQFLGANQNGARGFLNAAYNPILNGINIISLFAMLKFPDRTLPEGFDPNSNMTDTTTTLTVSDGFGGYHSDTQLKTIYTAPVSSVYTAVIKIRTPRLFGFTSSAFINRYGAVSSIPTSGIYEASTTFTNGAYEFNFSWATYMDAGDRLAVGVFNIAEILQDSFFQVNDLDFIEKTYEAEENYLVKTSFDYPLTSQTWQDFLDDRYGEITVNHPNGQIRGFLNDATRRLEDGLTDWEIRSNFGNS